MVKMNAMHPIHSIYPGEWPRWQSRRALNSPPFMSTPKSRQCAEQPSLKKTETDQKRYCTAKDIKMEPQ